MRSAIDGRISSGLEACYVEEETRITESARIQLEEYFSGERTIFDLPLQMTGSPFQQKVWNELLKIPYGKTLTYLGLSVRLGDEKAVRAVAAANGANALAIIIPCHRIIGSDGRLTGYAGGLRAKRALLRMESKDKVPQQLEMFEL